MTYRTRNSSAPIVPTLAFVALCVILIAFPGVVPAITGWLADLITPTLQDSVRDIGSTTTTLP
jgi:hypothetical protein